MRRAGVVAVLCLLLAGCTSPIGGSPMPTPSTGRPPSLSSTAAPTSTPGRARSALAAALSRVPASALGSGGNLEFGNTARLRQLAGATPATWQPQLTAGASALAAYSRMAPDIIGVDLSSAATALTVGQPPRSTILVTGGQSAAKITTVARISGWAGDEVLSKDLDLTKDPAAVAAMSLVANKIRPLGSDVVLTQQGGDPTGVSAEGAVATSRADEVPTVRAALACLGDLPVAAATGIGSADPTALTAVGAGPGEGGAVSSVICFGAADPAAAQVSAAQARAALATGSSRASRRPWTTLLAAAEVDVLPGSPAMVRIRADTADPGLTLKMMLQRDIPGR